MKKIGEVSFFATLFINLIVVSVCAEDVKKYAKDAVRLGWQYYEKGDLETALKRFNQARIIDPDFAPAYFGMAYIYSVQEKYDLAVENYRKSIEIESNFSPAYSNLGLALLYQDKPDEALPLLKKAIDLDPSNADAHVNIAAYYFRVGDYATCWQHVHAAQKLGADVRGEFIKELTEKMPEPKN